MELTELINHIKAIQVAGEVERKDVNSICYDSRKVKKIQSLLPLKDLPLMDINLF
jgi:hypothetical protein